MNDRFKFRVFDKETNKMFVPQRHFNCTEVNGTIVCIESYMAVDGFYKKRIVKEFNDAVLMQCTGLKDKNGKLIFEGDILNVFVDSIKPHYMPKEVIWDRKEWQLAQRNKNYKKCENCANRNKTKCSYCKEYFMSTGHTNFKDFYNGFIIGNIYENPELLEKQI